MLKNGYGVVKKDIVVEVPVVIPQDEKDKFFNKLRDLKSAKSFKDHGPAGEGKIRVGIEVSFSKINRLKRSINIYVSAL